MVPTCRCSCQTLWHAAKLQSSIWQVEGCVRTGSWIKYQMPVSHVAINAAYYFIFQLLENKLGEFWRCLLYVQSVGIYSPELSQDSKRRVLFSSYLCKI